MLTAAQKTLVQDTFAIITPIADDAAALFYQRLFKLDPSLERMFRGDMKEQRKKLMQMLTAAVKGVDQLDQLVPVVEDLGRRHARYGVEDRHYDTVGAALLWTLEAGLGELRPGPPSNRRLGRRSDAGPRGSARDRRPGPRQSDIGPPRRATLLAQPARFARVVALIWRSNPFGVVV
jgi:hemoglobin-like flavoprotein